MWMSNSLAIWRAARGSSRKLVDTGFLTHLALHAAEHQGKINAPHFPSHAQVEVTSLCRPLPAQGHPATLFSPLAIGFHHIHTHLPVPTQTSSAAGTTLHRIRSSKQMDFPKFFLKTCHELTLDPRLLLRRRRGDTRHSCAWQLLEMLRGNLSKQPLPPKLSGPTSQRNKRLLKLGRITYPCSSVKGLLVAPHDASSIHHSNAVLWYSFASGEMLQAKDYQHTSSSPGASYQAQAEGISLKL